MYPNIVKIEFNEQILFTKDTCNDVEKLRDAELRLFEKNYQGDCLCVVNGRYLIDIDHRDIKTFSILKTPEAVFIKYKTK